MDIERESEAERPKTPREQQFDRFLDALRQVTAEPPTRVLDATFRRLALARIADTQPLHCEPGSGSDARDRGVSDNPDGSQPTGLS